MPPPPIPSAGHFDYCRKPLFHPISASLLLSHTVICIFSFGFLPYLFQFILSHLLFTCFSSFSPSPVFLFPPSLWQLRASSKCMASHELSTCFGHFYWYEKVQSCFSFVISYHNTSRWRRNAIRWMNIFLARLHFLIVQCMHTLIFHLLSCSFGGYLVLSCSNCMHRLSSACSLACRQAERGRGEEKVKRRERVANEVWVKI